MTDTSIYPPGVTEESIPPRLPPRLGNRGIHDEVGENQAIADNPDNPEYWDTKEKYKELVSNFINDGVAYFDNKIIEQEENHMSYTRRARSAQWALNDLKSTKQALVESDDKRKDHLESEFDALLRHSKIEALGVRGTELLIKTVDLNMEHPNTGEIKYLGKFEIVFPIVHDRVNNLEVLNKTNAREHSSGEIYHHPHVVDGNPCFGALEADMFDSLSNGEFVAAFELLLNYLGTINPDDSYGVNWDLWE